MKSPSANGDKRRGYTARLHGVRVGHLYLDVVKRQLLWLNDAARDLHQEGVPVVAADLSDHPVHTTEGDLVTAADLPLLRACKERTPQHATFLWHAPDGILWQVDWTATPTHDVAGKLVGVMATVAVTAPEPDWQVLAGLTHDLRPPLQAVQLSAQLMDDTGSVPADLDELVLGLRAAAERALAVSRDLLEWCRKPATNGRRVERVSIPLGSFLGALIAEHVPTAQKKGLRLLNSCQEEVQGWELQSDPVRLGRLISNLLTNAIRYTRAGSVEVLAQWRQPPPANGHAHFGSSESAIQRRPALVLSVVDTGVGIAREDQDSIFQPFRHGRDAKDHDSSASGLGLAVVERLAEELGLHLEAFTEPGCGTAFDVVLPGRLLRTPATSLAQ